MKKLFLKLKKLKWEVLVGQLGCKAATGVCHQPHNPKSCSNICYLGTILKISTIATNLPRESGAPMEKARRNTWDPG